MGSVVIDVAWDRFRGVNADRNIRGWSCPWPEAIASPFWDKSGQVGVYFCFDLTLSCVPCGSWFCRRHAVPRMADFAHWATACEGALWPAGTFAKAYDNNRAEAVERLIGADPVVSAVRVLITKRPMWTGTASQLDNYLRALTGNLEATLQGWPQDPARLARRLRELTPSLNKIGIEVILICPTPTATRETKEIPRW